MFWFWTITTITVGLLAGLLGYHIGDHPAALAFTIAGSISVLAIKNILHRKHSILAGCIIAFTIGWYYMGLGPAAIITLLAFSVQLSIDDFVHKRSALAPIALTITSVAWWLGFHYFDSMSALIIALISFLAVIGVDDYFLQRSHTILRNFPLLGWCRYGFELIGDELRQYWFMSDTEEWPYNRETRQYVYRSAKGINNNLGFGSQRPYRQVGEIHLLPTMFPTPDDIELGNRLPPLVIGKRRKKPYTCAWPINISGMSWGSLSAEAVMALSSGAKFADIHLVTGEGGLTPYHTEGAVKRIPPLEKLKYNLRFLLHKASLSWFDKPKDLPREVIGGGRLVIQLGPAKFGFRQMIQDAVGSAADRGYRKRWSNDLDWERLRKVAESDQVVAFEIKMAQGGKPGQGGKLPKEKITDELSEWRGIPKDKDCYSPNAWAEFNDVPSMFAFVKRVQDTTGKPVGIKIAVGQEKYLHEIAAKLKELGDGPDFITIDGGEGGTGAAPVALADHMGLPILHSIPMVENIFREHGVRDDIVLIASGQISKGSDVAIAIALGADMVNIGRGNLLAEGCIMAMKCHTNTCPVGITSQNPRFRRGLDPIDKYRRVANYNLVLQRELLSILKSIGVVHPWQLTRHHLSVVTSPMIEQVMAEIHPYPDGDDGSRNPELGETPDNDQTSYDRFGPRLIQIKNAR